MQKDSIPIIRDLINVSTITNLFKKKFLLLRSECGKHGKRITVNSSPLSVLIFLFSFKSVSLIDKHSDTDVSEEKFKRWFVTLMESLT